MSEPEPGGASAQPWTVWSTLERPPAAPSDAEPGGPHLKELILARLFGGDASPPRIGRFALLRLLGEGGMGVVYAAYDDVLDRKVAIKLLRAESTPRRDVQRARMLREAKLTAQLSHPNVITVHEVGEHDGQIFIAMEFVRGEPLDRWLARAAGDRPNAVDWRAVIAVFAQAGAGLVAAHRAGLVHRDFKPQNVMVGDDGVVKVLDFGLAREALDDSRRSGEAARDPELPPAPASTSLTQTGAVMGTPAYMAPEQHLGRAADERSDQFSFCVSLWEALHGQHPFAGTTLFALQAEVLAGRIREPPAGTPVPARIRRLLARGMAVRPEDRHPSLAALLAELGRDPAAVRRRWLAVGGLALAASTAGFALAAGTSEAPCSGVADELAGVWDDDRRGAVAAALRATGLPYADETWARVAPALDAYARDWTDMRAASCQAHADALESDRHYDLRTACLARRRGAVDTLVTLLAAATPADVENAARAVAALPPLAACGDTEALAAAVPPPEVPTVARAVEGHRAELARAREYEALGRFAEARARIEPALASREAAEYPPLEAEAALALGAVELAAARHEDATAALTRSLVASLRSGHLVVAAEAFSRRIFTMAQTGATEPALRDAPLARALVDRSRDPQLDWLLRNNVGVVYFLAHRFAEAEEQLRAALAVQERDGGGEAFALVSTLGNLASVATALGDIQGARAYQVRGLEIAERALGPEHPTVSRASYSLARADHYSGRFRAARARMEAAVTALAGVYGADAEELFNCYLQLAALANDRRASAEALAVVERASAVRAAHDLAAHPNLPFLFIHGAVALAGLARHNEAAEALRQGLELVEARRNPVHDPGDIHEAVGRIALIRGDAPAALAAFRRLTALREADPATPPALRALADFRVATALHRAGELEPAAALALAALTRFLDSPQRHFAWVLAELRLGLGEILLDLGRADEARVHFEAGSRELGAISEPDNPTLALLEFGAARSLASADPRRAEALARAAATALHGYAPGFAAEAAAVDRFLRDSFATSPPGGN